MRVISLDIEATDSGEMLELSVIGHADREILYHSYFKPAIAKSWPNSEAVHHITPGMVSKAPSVKVEKKRILDLLRDTDAIIGFAIDNDIRYLEGNGIPVPAGISILEVRDWFWYYVGKSQGMEFGKVPRLAKCAELLGFDFSEETEAHSATNDTLMTIKVFDAILQHAGIEAIDAESVRKFDEAYAEEKALHAKMMARGFITLIKSQNGYFLKNNHEQPDSPELTIPVESRYMAEHEIRTKFKKRQSAPDSPYYALRPADLDFFRSYTNSYDAEKEDFYRHIYKVKKKSKSTLGFNLF